ncbi:MAG: hypothetical protein ACK56I_09610, partial [bacterium]
HVEKARVRHRFAQGLELGSPGRGVALIEHHAEVEDRDAVRRIGLGVPRELGEAERREVPVFAGALRFTRHGAPPRTAAARPRA